MTLQISPDELKQNAEEPEPDPDVIPEAKEDGEEEEEKNDNICLLYTSPSPRDLSTSRMPSSA